MAILLYRVVNSQNHVDPMQGHTLAENEMGTPVAFALCLFHYSHISFQKINITRLSNKAHVIQLLLIFMIISQCVNSS